MFKNVSAFLISLVCGILIIVLFFVNFGQRLHQPRYRLPGHEYAVTINNNPPQYYVFGKNRNEGKVFITNDKNVAKTVAGSVKRFNQYWKLQSQNGDDVYYSANHHQFNVAHSGNTMANFSGDNVRVDGRHVSGNFNNQQTGSVKAHMNEVKQAHPMRKN